MNSRNWSAALVYLTLGLQPLFSGTTGKISGRVTNKATGDPLIGANVMVVGTPLGAATDTEGNYYILQISPEIHQTNCPLVIDMIFFSR